MILLASHTFSLLLLLIAVLNLDTIVVNYYIFMLSKKSSYSCLCINKALYLIYIYCKREEQNHKHCNSKIVVCSVLIEKLIKLY